MEINSKIKELADFFYENTTENNEVYFVKWTFPNNKLVDLSYEKSMQDLNLANETLKSVQKFREEELTHNDEIILDILEYYCHYIKKNQENYWYRFEINHYTSPLDTLLNKVALLKVDTIEEKNRYEAILKEFPLFIHNIKEKMIKQAEMYIRLPVICCNLALETIEENLACINRFPKTEHGIELIEKIKHELYEMKAYIKNEYMIYAPNTIGVGQFPGGDKFYQRQIHTYISCNELPIDIQKKGYAELEIVKGKMKDIIEKLGYTCSIDEFNNMIKEDERFKYKTPQEMQEKMMGYLDLVRPMMKKYFTKMPKADCNVARIDETQEMSTSWGYYNIPVESPIGTYYYSAAELENRCQIRTAAIVYHELLPGHHYQMNLVLEDESLPQIIRNHYNTACADGWAEYASGFCREIGLYSIYDEYGRLTWDAFLCCRLVVDTGLNALGWSYEKAEDFLLKNTLLTKREIHTELLRYTIAMPGQALSYKWGSIEFFKFRAIAQETLGELFNLKKFHEEMLYFGAIPLNILEKHFHWYIKEELKAKEIKK